MSTRSIWDREPLPALDRADSSSNAIGTRRCRHRRLRERLGFHGGGQRSRIGRGLGTSPTVRARWRSRRLSVHCQRLERRLSGRAYRQEHRRNGATAPLLLVRMSSHRARFWRAGTVSRATAQNAVALGAGAAASGLNSLATMNGLAGHRSYFDSAGPIGLCRGRRFIFAGRSRRRRGIRHSRGCSGSGDGAAGLAVDCARRLGSDAARMRMPLRWARMQRRRNRRRRVGQADGRDERQCDAIGVTSQALAASTVPSATAATSSRRRPAPVRSPAARTRACWAERARSRSVSADGQSNGAVAIGDPNTANGNGAIAVGANNTATGNGAR